VKSEEVQRTLFFKTFLITSGDERKAQILKKMFMRHYPTFSDVFFPEMKLKMTIEVTTRLVLNIIMENKLQGSEY